MAPKPKYRITKEMLEELHTTQKLTIHQIAEQIGCEYSLILYYLKKFGIKKLPKYERLEGQRFGRLTVIKLIEVNDYGAIWECRCDCGNITHANTGRLKFGKVRSCGCLSREKSTSHGMATTRLYAIWKGMKSRCTNKNQPNYKQYGGAGISYHPNWETFENFYQDMGTSYSDGMSIERIDNSKGYYKENCRWATPAEQNRNMRSNVTIRYHGAQYCLTDLALLLGISKSKLYYYHKKGLRDNKLIDRVTK